MAKTLVPDRGIPMPSGRRKYPFTSMKVGESVFIPDRNVSEFNGSVQFAAKKTGGKFASRTVTEKGTKGTRVWRVS